MGQGKQIRTASSLSAVDTLLEQQNNGKQECSNVQAPPKMIATVARADPLRYAQGGEQTKERLYFRCGPPTQGREMSMAQDIKDSQK